MELIKIARTNSTRLSYLGRITLALLIGMVFLLLPQKCLADIENLDTEGYSSSITITNPSNGYEAAGGNIAHSSYPNDHALILGESRDHLLLSDTMRSLLADFYYQYSPPLAEFINGKGHLRSITRMGLLPLVGASFVFARVNLAERWPLLITIAVILSVLLYMELLIRRYRRPRRKRVHPENVSHFSNGSRSGITRRPRNSEKG